MTSLLQIMIELGFKSITATVAALLVILGEWWHPDDVIDDITLQIMVWWSRAEWSCWIHWLYYSLHFLFSPSSNLHILDVDSESHDIWYVLFVLPWQCLVIQLVLLVAKYWIFNRSVIRVSNCSHDLTGDHMVQDKIHRTAWHCTDRISHYCWPLAVARQQAVTIGK